MKLTAMEVKSAKPEGKARKLFDGGGMYLLITASGSKLWRMAFRWKGKQDTLCIGAYLDLSLAEAREARDKARNLLAKKINPKEVQQAEKVSEAGMETFKFVALEWHGRQKAKLSEEYANRILTTLKKEAFPYIGEHPINEITAPQLLKVARRIEARGAIESAHRALSICGQVFRYAVASGMAERNPAADLRGALTPTISKHHPSITDPKKIGPLLQAIEGYEGHPITRCALRLAPLVFVRPGELRHAEWKEIDLEAAEWRIPAEKMKAREKHIVPLSRQAIAVLKEIYPLTGPSGYVFPGVRVTSRPMSNNTVNAALRRLGYTKEEMTGHGFRSMASTLLNEMGFNRDAIERQLAHKEANEVRAAYNYAEHLEYRRDMMQKWADYLDCLLDGGKVIPFRSAG